MSKGGTRLGDFFANRRERGKAGLPILSVTLRDGLVPRESLDRRQESELDDGEHLLARKGDIVYNMMRMWQGASGIAPHDALVSPAYVVLRPKAGIDPLFASYWFKSQWMIYLFWAYSYGITEDRLRLYFKDFADIPARPPPIIMQQRLASIFSEIERAARALDRLAAAKLQARNGLIQALVSTGKPRPLTEVARVEFSGVDKKAIAGEIPVFLCNYTDVYANNRIVAGLPFMPATAKPAEIERFNLQAGDVLFTKDSETAEDIAACAFVPRDLPDVLCGYHLAIARPRAKLIRGDYLFFAMQSQAVRAQFSRVANGVVRFGLTLNMLEQVYISVPNLERQKAIASALASQDAEIEILAKQVEALRSQQRGLMVKFLSPASCSKRANGLAT